ncbi:hypothetical protein EYR40_000140 [Pleurotus pulmonarius]|nr:hypothetical protein EYR40_000140 [Pleurotus pulmonarius]
MSSRPATPCEARASTEDLGSAFDGACPPPDYRKALKVYFDELYPHLFRHLTRSSADARPTTRQKISQATEEQLWELSTDIYDEFVRRTSPSLQGTRSLPAQQGYHPKRNAARQKLASLSDERFEVLCGDVFQEISRRYPEFYNCESGDSISETSLALSCWIMRQEFPRGLQRARFPNKLRTTAPAYSTACPAIEEKPVVAYQDGSELDTTHSVDSARSEETLIASISESEKPRQATPSRRRRGKCGLHSLCPIWLRGLRKVIHRQPRAQNKTKESSRAAPDSSIPKKLVSKLGRPPPAPLPVYTNGTLSPLPTGGLPSDTPVPHTPTHGLLAQLNHLLPRHTIFHVRLHIHEIASVPLVSGEFAAKWRFKNVQAVPGSKQGFLGIGKRRRNTSRSRTPSGQEQDAQAKAGSEDGRDSGSASPEVGSSEDTPSIPSVVVSRHPGGAATQPPTPISQISPDWHPGPSLLSPSLSSSRIPTLSELSSSLYRQPEEQSTPSLTATTPVNGYASSRGITTFGQLKEHKVVWNHTVDVVVKMDVERDTLELLPNELKLEVMQRVIPNDPSAPQNPRLGVLYLNLAQYASPTTPSVTRRYLLQKSKTNATLKLTVQLECVGGERNFVAPPLPKGQILGGVKGVLDSDVLRLRPRIAGLERGMAMAMTGPMGFFPELGAGNGPGVKPGPFPTSNGAITVAGEQYTPDTLSLMYGPRMTENIIDAIFNPVPTTDKAKQGPFTYYLDPSEEESSTQPESSSPSSPTSTGSASSPHPRHPPHTIKHNKHGDGASVYSTESSSSVCESISVQSHHSHHSSASNAPSTSTHSTHSSLGIGLGVSMGPMGIVEQRRSSAESAGSGEAAEPAGRMKGWWKRMGHNTSGANSPMTRQETLTPPATSPAMPSVQIAI